MVVNRSRANSRQNRQNRQDREDPVIQDALIQDPANQEEVPNNEQQNEVRIQPQDLLQGGNELPGAAVGDLPGVNAPRDAEGAEENVRLRTDIEALQRQSEFLSTQMARLIAAFERMPTNSHPVSASGGQNEVGSERQQRSSSPARSADSLGIDSTAMPAENRQSTARQVPDSHGESFDSRATNTPSHRGQMGVVLDPLSLMGDGLAGPAAAKIHGVHLQTFSGFHSWAKEVERLFTVLNWLDYIREDMPLRYPDSQDVKMLDLKIGLLLDSHISPKIKEELERGGESAYHIWVALNRWYRAEGIAKRNQSFEALMSLRLVNRNIDEYLTQFRKLTNDIRSKSANIEDLFKYILLRGLGRDGEALQQTFANTTLSAGDLAAEIHDRFNSHKSATHSFPNRYSSTLSLRSNSKTKDRRKHSNRSPASRRSAERRPASEPQMTEEQKEKHRSTKCHLCGKIGHPINFCYKLSSVKINADLSSGSETSSESDPEELPALGLVFFDEDTDQEEVTSTSSVSDDASAAAHALQVNSVDSYRDRFIFDTGASVHICNNVKWFRSMKPSNRRFRTSNEGSMLLAEGIGTVSLVLESGKELIIEGVYYCPNACQNLLTNVGLNGLLKFHVDNAGVTATLEDGDPFRLAEIKNGQNVVCACPPVEVNFVTRSGREPALVQSRGREERQSASRGRSPPRQNDIPATGARPRGRPRKLPKTPIPEVSVSVPSQTAGDESADEPVDEESDDEQYFPMDSDVEDPEAIELEKEYLRENFSDDPLVINDEIPFEDQLLNDQPPERRSNALWREAAKRSGLKDAVDVHIACGHSGERPTERTCKLYGIKYKPFNCEVCRIYNQNHAVNRRSRLNPAQHPLEIVYIDFCQPFGWLQGYDGSNCSMVILDEYTGFATVYNLEHRSQWLDFFKLYLKKAERRHNRKLIEIRTDNALEFISDEVKHFEATEGITHSFICPYIHENAAFVERLNQSLEYKAIKLLAAAKLSNRYWPEAMLYAAELYNRTVNYKARVPFTSWFGKVCDRKRLAFGIPVVFLRYGNQGKPIKGKAIFFGYARNRKAYRIQADDETFVREDVYFVKPLVAHPGSQLPTVEFNPYDEFISSIYAVDSGDDEHLDFDPSQKREILSEIHCAVQSVLESDSPRFIPRRFSEVIRMTDRAAKDRWVEATRVELDEMVKNDVFTLVKRSDATTKPIGTQYVYNLKEGKERARLVARGDWQSVDTYADTYAPTLSLAILRVLLKIAITEDLEVHNFDVRRAFLKAPILEDVYLEIPDGYHLINPEINLDNRRSYLLRLNKALYGLKQAGRLWFETITSKLTEFGFIPLAREPTVFIHRTIPRYYIAVYVDDLVCFAANQKLIGRIRRLLTESFAIHDRGALTKVLGIDICRSADRFTLSLKPMIEALCIRHNIQPDARTNTPLASGEVPDPAPNAEPTEYTEYLSLLGSLLYIARTVRPDILIGIVQLAQFSSAPKKLHLRRLVHILRYLRNTADLNHNIYRSNGYVLEVYTDSSLGNSYDQKSFSGTAVFVGKSLVSYSARKSELIAQSTNEAEVIAASEGLRDLLFMHYVVCVLIHPAQPVDEFDDTAKNREKCIDCPKPVLYTDSAGALSFIDRGFVRRSKHLQIRNAALIDYARRGDYEAKYVQSSANPADCLTKNLRFVTLEHQRKLLGITCE